jgi:hypothetical protein
MIDMSLVQLEATVAPDTLLSVPVPDLHPEVLHLRRGEDTGLQADEVEFTRRPRVQRKTQACPCWFCRVIPSTCPSESSASPPSPKSPPKLSSWCAVPASHAAAASHVGGRIQPDYCSSAGCDAGNVADGDGFSRSRLLRLGFVDREVLNTDLSQTSVGRI